MAGLFKRAGDLVYTFRFLKLLTTSFEETDAYRLKIIDKNGKRDRSIEVTSDMKKGKYDKIDLSRSIFKGNIKDSSFSKRDVLKSLYYDLKDRFTKYGRRKK